MKTGIVIPIVILLAGVLVAFAVYMTTTSNTGNASPVTGNISFVRPVSVQDHILGDPNAPVKLIEYSDFDCHYCGVFQHTLQRIMHDYGPTGDVAWVFREFPLEKIHPNALATARAAECVAKTAGNDAFWKFADLMFINQPVNPINFGQYAAQAGANPTAVANCIMNGSVNARVASDIANALKIGARGTPYTVILGNGAAPVVVDAAYPYSYIKQEIDTALAVASSSANR